MAHTKSAEFGTEGGSAVEDLRNKLSRRQDGSLHPGRTIHGQGVRIDTGYLICSNIPRHPHAPASVETD